MSHSDAACSIFIVSCPTLLARYATSPILKDAGLSYVTLWCNHHLYLQVEHIDQYLQSKS